MQHPIVQAPMVDASTPAMAAAGCEAAWLAQLAPAAALVGTLVADWHAADAAG